MILLTTVHWTVRLGSSLCLRMPVRSHSLSMQGTPSFPSLAREALSSGQDTQNTS